MGLVHYVGEAEEGMAVVDSLDSEVKPKPTVLAWKMAPCMTQ